MNETKRFFRLLTQALPAAALGAGLLLGGCGTIGPAQDDVHDGPVEPPEVDPELLQDPDIAAFFDTHVAEVKADPESAKPWQSLGEAYHAQMLFPEADTCYSQAIRLTEPEPEPRLIYLRGIARYNRGDREAAIADMERVMELDPYPPARWRLGYFYLEQNDPEAALGYFAQVTDENPGDSAAVLGVARALLMLDRPEDAIRILEPLRPLDPLNEPYIRSLLADAYRRQGDTAKAESVAVASDSAGASLRDEWLELLEFKLKGHLRQMEAATRLIELNQFNLALEVLKREQAKYPDDAKVVGAMGLAHMHRSEFDKAIEYSEQAIEMDPELADGYHQLAVSYYNKGFFSEDREAGMAFFEKAKGYNQTELELDPTNPAALNVKGQILADSGSPAEAIEAYKEAFDHVDPGKQPDVTGYLHAAARLEGSLGRWSDSEQTLIRATRAAPDDALGHVLLAIAYVELGDLDAARASYQRALPLVPADPPQSLKQDLAQLEERLNGA